MPPGHTTMNPINEDISFDEEGHIKMVYEHINSDEQHSMVDENTRSNESDYSDIENETDNYKELENEEIQEGAREEEDHDSDQFLELSQPNVSGQILIPFRPKHALTGDLVLNTINAVLQSNEQIQIDNHEASIHLVTVTPPQGSDHQCYMQPEVNEENEIDLMNDDVLEGMKNITAIAHNSGGFDNQFIMQFLYRKGHHKVEIVNKDPQNF
uniref:Uncharacterized protein n=1 Tax=Romanomermis culicivorax TaxID=13658 RepID=A0A915KNR0_ROMCU